MLYRNNVWQIVGQCRDYQQEYQRNLVLVRHANQASKHDQLLLLQAYLQQV